MHKTYPVLSIRQPWAGLLALGIKNIENRTWPAAPKYYGQTFLIHAGKQPDRELMTPCSNIIDAAEFIVTYVGADLNEFKARLQGNKHVFALGGIAGSMVLNSCTKGHKSVWAMLGADVVHWEVGQAKPLPFMALKGRLGIFQAEYPHAVEVGNV